jgi:hypothetical protein
MSTEQTRDLQQVITDWLGDAAVLRRHGQHALAEQLESCARIVQESAEEFLTMLTESEAALFSGETVRWLQSRFPAFERRGMAEKRGKTRFYRQCALPRRAETARAFEAGRDAARKIAG